MLPGPSGFLLFSPSLPNTFFLRGSYAIENSFLPDLLLYFLPRAFSRSPLSCLISWPILREIGPNSSRRGLLLPAPPVSFSFYFSLHMVLWSGPPPFQCYPWISDYMIVNPISRDSSSASGNGRRIAYDYLETITFPKVPVFSIPLG